MTLKKAIMIGLVCVVVALLSTVAYAGWGGCCGFWFVGSLEPELIVKGGSSDDAFVLWSATPLVTELVCFNPAMNQASPTVMIRQVALSDLEPIDQSTGRNGKPRLVEGDISTDLLAADPNDCVNPNWHPQPETVLVREFVASAEVFTLNDDGTKTEFLATYVCEYPGPITAEDLIPLVGNPNLTVADLFPNEDDRKYDCDETIVQK